MTVPTGALMQRLAPVAAVLLLAGCGGGAGAAGGPGTATEKAATEVSAASGFPLTVESCGRDIVLEAPPERVVVLGADPLPLLDAVDALDRVVGFSAPVLESAFDPELLAEIEALPDLGGTTDGTGHTTVSQEVVLSLRPDLVLTAPGTLDVDALAAQGVPVYVAPAFCAGGRGSEAAAFDQILTEVETYGAMFGEQDLAADANRELSARLEAVEPVGAGRSVAFTYPTTDGTVLYAYGTSSMTHPTAEALGLENVFADTAARVFEVGPEQMIARDPDVVVVLYSTGTPEAAERAFAASAAGASLLGTSDPQIVPLEFALTDPPTPLTVTGVERIRAALTE